MDIISSLTALNAHMPGMCRPFQRSNVSVGHFPNQPACNSVPKFAFRSEWYVWSWLSLMGVCQPETDFDAHYHYHHHQCTDLEANPALAWGLAGFAGVLADPVINASKCSYLLFIYADLRMPGDGDGTPVRGCGYPTGQCCPLHALSSMWKLQVPTAHWSPCEPDPPLPNASCRPSFLPLHIHLISICHLQVLTGQIAWQQSCSCGGRLLQHWIS